MMYMYVYTYSTGLMQHGTYEWYTFVCEQQYICVQAVTHVSVRNSTCECKLQQEQTLTL